VNRLLGLVAGTVALAALGSATVGASGATSSPLRGAVVVLDPGHDGGNGANATAINRPVDAGGFWKACDTVGAMTASGYPEHAFTFAVATAVATDLRHLGATVVLTRRNDSGVGPCIDDRARLANVLRASAAVSIHADGGPPWGRGFTVLVPETVVTEAGTTAPMVARSAALGRDLAAVLRTVAGLAPANYAGRAGLEARGDLGGLNRSEVPKVFIECANLPNAADASLVTTPSWRTRLAAAIALGLERFLRHR